jgi:4'-phosphopantetheinyl transferase EntD
MTSVLESLFPHASFVAEAAPRLADDELLPEERAHIRGAVASRRAEFATARLCARRGLAAMGIAPVPLVPAQDRAPTWPDGVVGSITHTHGYCAVVLGRSPPLRSIGLDVEGLRELEEGVVDLILTERERAWLGSQGDARSRSSLEQALLVFSAKEAFYKCQYPLTHRYLDFHDVELDVPPRDGRFSVTVRKPDWPAVVARLEGRFAFGADRVFCGVELLA